MSWVGVAALIAAACGGPRFFSTDRAAEAATEAGAEEVSLDAAVDAPPDSSPDTAESAIPADGLLLWLSADRGIALENGWVAGWADQSQQHSDALQAMADARPSLAASGVQFDGIDDYLQLPAGFTDFTRGISLFAVFQESSVGDYTALVELSNGSEIDDISLGEHEGIVHYEVQDFDLYGDALPFDSPQLLSVVHGPDLSVRLYRNGALVGQASGAPPASVERLQNFLGKSLYSVALPFPGQLAEVILYGRAVTDDEFVAIEYYLRNHWSCCGS